MMAARRIAGDVLEFLMRKQVAPTPAVYRLFFEHAAGGSAAVSSIVEQAIGDSVRSGRPLAERIADELSDEAAEDALFDAAAALASQLARLDSQAEEASAASRHYARELGEADRTLGTAGASQESLSEMLGALLEQHRALIQANARLTADLNRAQQEIAATRAELSRTAREAMRDPVTGLINRRGAEEELVEMVASGTDFSLVMIDIDRFKPLNDCYGHQAGDRVLHEVGRALLAAVRAGDSAYRFGGDEFAAIIHSVIAEELGAAAERLRQSVADIDLARCIGGDVVGNLTISLGVAPSRPKDHIADLFERADAALFEAKRAGRNRWSLAG